MWGGLRRVQLGAAHKLFMTSPHGYGRRIATVEYKRNGKTFTRRQPVGSKHPDQTSGVSAGNRDSDALSLAPETVDAEEATMSEWGESRRHLMTPQTIEMNERLHAYDLAHQTTESIAEEAQETIRRAAREARGREVRATLASRPAGYITAQMESVFHDSMGEIIDRHTSEGLGDPDKLADFDHETYTAVLEAGHTHDLATKGNHWAHRIVAENTAAAHAVTEAPMFAEEFKNLILANSSSSYVESEHLMAKMRSTVRRALISDGKTKATADRGAEWAMSTTRANAVEAQRRYVESGLNMIVPDDYDPYAHRL